VKDLVRLDATAPTTFFLTDADIAAGVPHDCMRCAIAVCIRRTMNQPFAHVEIYQSIALIEQPVDAQTIKDNVKFGTPGADTLKPGDMAIVRYHVDRVLRSQVQHFDDVEEADAIGYRFLPMVPSQRYVAERNKKGKRDGSRPYLSRRRSPWMRARGPISDSRKRAA
jgi:hypothetical protein